MKRFYAVLNLIVLIAVIAWNYLSNTGQINGKTIGDVSDDLHNLFTPAGYAFAIWGLIFIGLIVNGIYQLNIAFGKDEIRQRNVLTGPWLIIANGVWIWCWLNEYTGASVIVMIVLLLALIKIAIDLRIALHIAPNDVILFGWAPNSIYLGWISVALIANVAAYLSKIGWALSVNEVNYAIAMILVATLLNLLMLFKCNMREFCLVGIWALIAIGIGSDNNLITTISWICSGIIAVFTAIHSIKNIKHNILFREIAD